jgi:hypothetical protein
VVGKGWRSEGPFGALRPRHVVTAARPSVRTRVDRCRALAHRGSPDEVAPQPTRPYSYRRHGAPSAVHARARGVPHLGAVLRRDRARAPCARMGTGRPLPRLGLQTDGRPRHPRRPLPDRVRRRRWRLGAHDRRRRGARTVGLGRGRDGDGRPVRHGDAADPEVRHRGAEAALPGTGDPRREDRVPGDHRAERRLGRGQHRDHGPTRRRRLRDQRPEDLHHERGARAFLHARDAHGQARGARGILAVPRRPRHAGVHRGAGA